MVANNKPSYKLIPVARTPSVDPGDRIEISIFVEGYGTIEKANLHTSFDHPNLVDPNSPGRFVTSMKPATFAHGGTEFPYTGLVEVYPIDSPTYVKMGIKPFLWSNEMVRTLIQSTPILSPGGELNNVNEGEFSQIVLSRPNQLIETSQLVEQGFTDDRDQIGDTEGDHPPIKMELQTLPSKTSSARRLRDVDKYCSPGDYEITFTLTYGDRRYVYQDQSKVTIHVNSWIERHTTVLRVAAVIFAAVAALAAAPTIVENLLELPRVLGI